ncbi:sugar phosphate isomerase/epimerase [Actinospica durhamensis]|uniref:Sugar phosphate isomerase/epimerase n=1 Tax=Actinospica durhamensis TaxID=1508375 RepID=A0A941EQP9_9ACTN|nr:TIM barrel protein [Actinospica durhamensis]MBR7835403.1 sugar phosphate isomerase/epimerase [Actinospica durhamensis]
MPNPLSVQLYTVRDLIAEDRDGVLRRLAELGFDAVEPFQPTVDPVGFRKVADDLGLRVSSAHAMGLIQDEDPSPVFEAIATLGTDLAVVPAGIAEEEFTTLEGLARTADRLNALAEKAKAHGMRLGYHNHWWEFEPVFEGRHALELLADLLAPEVVLEVDTYWAAVGGADAPSVLRNLGDRVAAIHVKDGPVVKGEPNLVVGTGRMPVTEVLAAAPNALRVVEFDACATDILEALGASRAYLAGLADEQGGTSA